MVDKFICIKRLAERYWQLRNQGDLGEERVIAHNALLDALSAAGIDYENREHAAQIGLHILKHNDIR